MQFLQNRAPAARTSYHEIMAAAVTHQKIPDRFRAKAKSDGSIGGKNPEKSGGRKLLVGFRVTLPAEPHGECHRDMANAAGLTVHDVRHGILQSSLL